MYCQNISSVVSLSKRPAFVAMTTMTMFGGVIDCTSATNTALLVTLPGCFDINTKQFNRKNNTAQNSPTASGRCQTAQRQSR